MRTQSEITLSWLPFALSCALLVVGVVLRSYLQWKRHGSTGIVLFREAGVGLLRDVAFAALGPLLLGQALIAWLQPAALRSVWLPISVPPPVATVAALCAFAAIVLMFLAQLDLGSSWRIGIDHQARPGLVTDGAYRICRNPIYACMLAALAALTVLLPTWPSLIVLFGVFIGIRAQVLNEETYLVHAYGDAFTDYAARVGRFVPGIGLLH